MQPATSQSCKNPEGQKYTISAYEPMRRKFYSKQGTQVVTHSAQNRGKCFQVAKIVPARAPTIAVIYRKAALKSNGLEDLSCLIYWGFFSGMGFAAPAFKGLSCGSGHDNHSKTCPQSFPLAFAVACLVPCCERDSVPEVGIPEPSGYLLEQSCLYNHGSSVIRHGQQANEPYMGLDGALWT